MSTNKYILWIMASLISGAFCAMSAMADAPRPEAYQRLTAVQLQPAETPRLAHGFSDLSGNERRFQEKLPLQLEGAIRKVKATKYKPHPRRHHEKRHYGPKI
jgi:hypothetical protein